MPRLLVASALIALALCSGCYTNTDNSDSTADGGSGDAGADAFVCTLYVPPSGTDLTTVTSFKTDVEPVFVNSCAFSGCHNENSAPNVFLGSKADATKNTGVRAKIVGVASTDLPSMPFVTPGDTSKSFLMRKMDGDQCLLDSQCKNAGDAGCQTSMPQNLPLIDVSERDKVRRWILQGALDN